MPRMPDEVLTDIGNALIRKEYITKFELGERPTHRKDDVWTDRILQLTLNDGHTLVILGHHDMEQAILTLTGNTCPRILVDLAKKHRHLNVDREQVVTTEVAIRRILKHLQGY